jgi:hypothetical protein
MDFRNLIHTLIEEKKKTLIYTQKNIELLIEQSKLLNFEIAVLLKIFETNKDSVCFEELDQISLIFQNMKIRLEEEK